MDTIAAIITTPGLSAVNIVKMSGDGALPIVERLFRPSRKGPWKPNQIRHGYVIDPHTGGAVDEVLVSFMAAPYSYTTEDVMEVNCHGGYVAAGRVLELLCRHGARPAEPGEFTKRAFLGGRIDLSSAEAVMDTVNAATEKGQRLALENLAGALYKKIEELRGEIKNRLAHVEAYIDFPEEEVPEPQKDELLRGIEGVLRALKSLEATYREGRLFREGAVVVITGAPNAGKSTLFNCLLRQERALVSSISGTTRDTVEEHLDVGGMPVRLVDTAGLTGDGGELEKMGVARTLARRKQADLELRVIDLSQNGAEREIDWDTGEGLKEEPAEGALIVLNKADLADEKSIREAREKYGAWCVLVAQAVHGEGVEEIKQAIFQALIKRDIEGEDAVLTRERYVAAVRESAENLRAAQKGIQEESEPEIIALELSSAWVALGRITGATETDEVLDAIFAEFCIGK